MVFLDDLRAFDRSSWDSGRAGSAVFEAGDHVVDQLADPLHGGMAASLGDAVGEFFADVAGDVARSCPQS